MSEHNDFEGRLRDALRTEGDSARVSPDALGKIRGRIEQPRRKHSPKRVIAFGAIAAAAACTTAVIVVPQLTGGPDLRSASAPESAAKDSAAQQDNDTSAAKPSETEASGESRMRQESAAVPVLGELVVGEDVNVLLTADISGDTATARLSASKWDGAKWGSRQGPVQVGAAGGLAFDGRLSGHVCEFRVVQAPGKPATVRVRLAQQSGGACSDAYVYELDGTTLRPK
ncbi:hypothetical protein [Flindersiella endophytica]